MAPHGRLAGRSPAVSSARFVPDSVYRPQAVRVSLVISEALNNGSASGEQSTTTIQCTTLGNAEALIRLFDGER